jgi:hypothetical protein
MLMDECTNKQANAIWRPQAFKILLNHWNRSLISALQKNNNDGGCLLSICFKCLIRYLTCTGVYNYLPNPRQIYAHWDGLSDRNPKCAHFFFMVGYVDLHFLAPRICFLTNVTVQNVLFMSRPFYWAHPFHWAQGPRSRSHGLHSWAILTSVFQLGKNNGSQQEIRGKKSEDLLPWFLPYLVTLGWLLSHHSSQGGPFI